MSDKYKVTSSDGVTKVIDWAGENAPTQDEVDNIFAGKAKSDDTDGVTKPTNPTNQSKSAYDTVKDLASSAWSKLSSPLLPERTEPGTMRSGHINEDEGFGTRALKEVGQRFYDVARGVSSPLALGTAAASEGTSELANIGAAAGLGTMATKGAYDAVEPVKKAINDPSISSLSDAYLAVASPILMGAGAASKMGSSFEDVPSSDNSQPVTPPVNNAPPPSADLTPVGKESSFNNQFEDVPAKSPEDSIYENVLAKRGGTQTDSSDETGLNKYESLDNTDNTPRLAGKTQNGSTLYLQFEGKQVTPEEVKSMFPDANISVTRYSKEGSIRPDQSRFRIDVFDKNDRSSSDEAAKLGNQLGDNFTDWSKSKTDFFKPSTQVNSEKVPFSQVNPDVMDTEDDTVPKSGLTKYEQPDEETPPDTTKDVTPEDTEEEKPNRDYGDYSNEFQDFVNARKSANLEGRYTGDNFSYLDQDSEGEHSLGTDPQINSLNSVNLLQKAMKEGNFSEVRQHLNDLHEQLNDNGVETQYKEDYLPQMWDNSPEEVKQAFGKRLTTNPSFTYQSFIKDYQEGIDAGLKPKFDKPSELLGYYTNYVKKSIADARFFDYLKTNKLVTGNKVSPDQLSLSPDYFPKSWGNRTYYADPLVKHSIENYFKNPADGNVGEQLLSKAADFTGKTARTVLGFHIPGTAWGMHGANTVISHSLFGDDLNPLKIPGRLAEALTYVTRPEMANQFLTTNPASAIKAVKDGGLSIDKWSSDIGKPLIEGDNLPAKALNTVTDPTPLFGKVIPALMLKAYESNVKSLMSSKIPYAQAAKLAGEHVNEQFGVLNRDALMQDKNVVNAWKVATLAPSWLESQGRLGLGMGKALLDPTNPAGKKYLSGITNFVATYAVLNVVNALANNGKLMIQNEPGHELSLALGQDSKGRTRYVNPYGSNMAMIKVPLEIAHAALGGDLSKGLSDVRSRASEPAQFATDLVSNSDWKNSPLLGKNNRGKMMGIGEQLGNVGSDALGHFLPIGAEGGIDLARGRITPEEAAAKLLQLPMSYKKKVR